MPFHGEEDGTRLPSNRSYATKEEAVESARIAYPLVPLRDVAKPAHHGRRRRRWPWLVVVLALALMGLVVVIALGALPAAIVLILRRRLRGRVRPAPRR